MFIQGSCNTGLTLGSTTIDHTPSDHLHNPQKRKSSLRFDRVIPSLTLGLSSSEKKNRASTLLLYRSVSHSVSATSSPYSSNSSMKRERDVSGEEVGIERERSSKVMISDINDHDQDAVEEGSTTARKKLRLTKEQSVVLEDRFKEHATLNPKQKQALAQQVNLQPRQVEVWFQNRRARTKLKQTEVEREQLKKLCETLTDENKRLQNEVQGLKALKITPPFYMQFPAAAPTTCPSCDRGVGCDENSSKNIFPIHTKPHFCNPFTHPSPAY